MRTQALPYPREELLYFIRKEGIVHVTAKHRTTIAYASKKNPPFRADQVGSLLRTAVKQARLQRAAGEISAEQLREIENREIIRSVEKQKETSMS